MKKVIRVKDLFKDLDEKLCRRNSEVSLAKFLPVSYRYAFIERSSSNRCTIFLKEYGSEFPKLNCKISYNAPLSIISSVCSDFKLTK